MLDDELGWSGKIMLGAMLLALLFFVISKDISMFFWGIFAASMGGRLIFGIGELVTGYYKNREWGGIVLSVLALLLGIGLVLEGIGLIFGIEELVIGISAP
ncbi:hypothetical protein ACJJIW_11295 [Microbulbifer sp. JMSA004]|uniref:hypothetical protein n=1 Tax=Microbulbifer sp. JMSA004 TaxID=3243370 RepID=UPI00403A369F